MKLRTSISILLVLFAFLSCVSKRPTGLAGQHVDEYVKEDRYYRIFIEATRNSLFGNFKYAVPLYEECISIYPENGAPYYQLSNIWRMQKDVEKSLLYAKEAYKRDTTNVWYLINLVNGFQSTGNADSTLAYFEKLNEISNDSEIEYNLALIYSQLGYPRKTIRLINTMSDELKQSREVMLLQHNAYHALKDYDSALFILEDIIDRFPDDVASYGMMAEYLTEIGRFGNARELYKQVIDKDSTNGLVLLSFAEFYRQNNQLDSAFITYNKAFCCSDLAYDDKISVIVNLMSSPVFLKDNEKALIELLNHIPADSRDFQYYAAFSDIYINLEKYAKAKPYLDSALIYEKTNYLLWEQTLLINNFLDNDKEVVRIASEAREYFSTKPNLNLVRAYSYNNLKEYSSAISDLDTVLNADINERMRFQANNLLAEIYRSKNQHEKSDSVFEAILGNDPTNLLVRNNYAYYLSLRSEKLERAEELSSFTVESDPQNATYLDTYGWVLFQMGKYKEAKGYVEEAIRNGAYNNPEVLEHYGDIMIALNKCKEGLEAYANILEIDSLNVKVKDKIDQVSATCEEK